MGYIIYPPQSPILANIFNYPIRYYGLIMAISFLLGVFIVLYLFKKKNLNNDAEIFLDYSPLVILFSIIGARLFYVLGQFEYYRTLPHEIFFINHGGLSLYGAIVFGLVAIITLSRIKKFDFLLHCDILSVTLPLCQSIGRFGNYFNQEAYGLPTNGFIKLYVNEAYRQAKYKSIEFFHPTFLYEAIMDFILFICLLYIFFQCKNLKKGTLTCLYLICYSIIRIIVETYRSDSILNVLGIPIAQIISLLILTSAIFSLIFINKKHV